MRSSGYDRFYFTSVIVYKLYRCTKFEKWFRWTNFEKQVYKICTWFYVSKCYLMDTIVSILRRWSFTNYIAIQRHFQNELVVNSLLAHLGNELDKMCWRSTSIQDESSQLIDNPVSHNETDDDPGPIQKRMTKHVFPVKILKNLSLRWRIQRF